MSEKKTERNDSSPARLTITLFAICAVCSLLLGLVNAMTLSKREEDALREKQAAMSLVLPCDAGYEQADYTGDDVSVASVYAAKDASGFVVEVSPTASFSGNLTLMVGVDASGAVSGVEITSSGETSGLGDNAKKPDFRAQFVGISDEAKVTKDGGTVDALSGATITSRAVCDAVNSALAAAASLS